ncbi:hypothetical protein SH501x_001926 [Pirellulaceae bacterium SH501]
MEDFTRGLGELNRSPMTETKDSQSQSPMSRGCVTALVAMTAIVGLLVVGIPYIRERQRLSFERQKSVWRQRAFDRVKNGDHRASIMDSKLLPMLASDADCVANLNELDFAMTEIMDEDAKFVSQLSNVRTLFFYDTRGADLVLENARDLPIVKMGFEMARLRKESLRSLSDFPKLKELHFEHVMFPNEIAILETLPPRITVRVPYLAENEPGFKERGEPADAPESR